LFLVHCNQITMGFVTGICKFDTAYFLELGHYASLSTHRCNRTTKHST
jgi:hypothetical protein